MSKKGSLQFRDAESGEEALAIVRPVGDHIGLCLSVRSDGDLEVFMATQEAKQLVAALTEAIQTVEGKGV